MTRLEALAEAGDARWPPVIQWGSRRRDAFILMALEMKKVIISILHPARGSGVANN